MVTPERFFLGVVILGIAVGLAAIAVDEYFLGAAMIFLSIWLREETSG